MASASGKGAVEFTVTPQGFRELLQRTAEFDKAQARFLRRNIRDAAKVVMGYVRTEVMGGTYNANVGLRAGIAAGLKVQVSTSQSRPGVTIRATSSAMPPGKAPMVKAWQKKGSFRHPVFGNPDVWAEQTGHPYFYKTVFEHRDKITKAVNAAMEQAAELLAGGSTA
jgi:hypothetical protein